MRRLRTQGKSCFFVFFWWNIFETWRVGVVEVCNSVLATFCRLAWRKYKLLWCCKQISSMNPVQARRHKSLPVWGVWWVGMLCRQRMCRNVNFANVLSILPPDKCLTSWRQPETLSLPFSASLRHRRNIFHCNSFQEPPKQKAMDSFFHRQERMFSLVLGHAVHTWTFISTVYMILLLHFQFMIWIVWPDELKGRVFDWLIDWFFIIFFFLACCLKNDFFFSSQKLTKCSEAAL